MKHAPLAPSSAARNMACAGSALLVTRYPEDETQDTLEGDAVHWAGAELLGGSAICVGQVAPNDITLDATMVDAAEMWAAYILARGPVGDIEALIVNDYFHPKNWGTPDHTSFGALTLYIDDLKYGFGYIEVVGNWQLINYAGLRLAELQKRYGANVWELDVIMTICQPRSYHRDGPIRTWKIKARDMLPYFEQMRKQYAVAMRPGALCVANPECGHCSARHDCEANAAGAEAARRLGYSSIPLGLGADQAGRELKMLKEAKALLDSRVSGLEQQLTTTLSRGVRVVGYCLDNGGGKTVWKRPQDEVIMLGQLLGAEFSKPGTITPIQAMTELKRLKIDPTVIAAYSETLPGAVKLTETANSAAAKAFSK